MKKIKKEKKGMNKIVSEKELETLLKKSAMFDKIMSNLSPRNARDVELLKEIIKMRDDTEIKADLFFLLKSYPNAD